MVSRRETLRALAGMAALPLVGSFGADELLEIGRRAHSLAGTTHAPRALTVAQHRLVSLAAERIIPRTTTPGATDARVADFIDVMLANWYSASERERFISGLNDLESRAQGIARRGFAQTSESQQTALLETLDRELQARRQSGVAGADDHWFAVLKHLTVWGYYTSRQGFEKEFRLQRMPGRYDGNAKY